MVKGQVYSVKDFPGEYDKRVYIHGGKSQATTIGTVAEIISDYDLQPIDPDQFKDLPNGVGRHYSLADQCKYAIFVLSVESNDLVEMDAVNAKGIASLCLFDGNFDFSQPSFRQLATHPLFMKRNRPYGSLRQVETEVLCFIKAAGALKGKKFFTDRIYWEIIDAIRSAGKCLEQTPSTFSSFKEPDLRNYILGTISGKFEKQLSITGESFNRSGKTDILIKRGNDNIFVAECKFWRGPKDHIDGLDQLLGYCTIRDCRTAYVSFVRQKSFSTIETKIKDTTMKHGCFETYLGRRDDICHNFMFHHLTERHVKIKLACLAFYLPS